MKIYGIGKKTFNVLCADFIAWAQLKLRRLDFVVQTCLEPTDKALIGKNKLERFDKAKIYLGRSLDCAPQLRATSQYPPPQPPFLLRSWSSIWCVQSWSYFYDYSFRRSVTMNKLWYVYGKVIILVPPERRLLKITRLVPRTRKRPYKLLLVRLIMVG